MPNYLGGLSLVANGNILPSSIVSLDPTGDHLCRQASGSGDTAIIGISFPAVDAPPGAAAIFAPGASYTPVAAASGEEVAVGYVGDVLPVFLGSGGCIAGQYLTSDSGGLAVTASSGNTVVGKAMQTGSAGDQVDVVTMLGKI